MNRLSEDEHTALLRSFRFPKDISTQTGKKFGTEAPRPIHLIAREIRRDWKKPYFGAVPYLEAMAYHTSLDEMHEGDTVESIVLYFLSNAKTWRGGVARHIKAELKAMLKAHGSK